MTRLRYTVGCTVCGMRVDDDQPEEQARYLIESSRIVHDGAHPGGWWLATHAYDQPHEEQQLALF